MEGLQNRSRQVAKMRPGFCPWLEPRLLSVLLALPLSPPWDFSAASETLQRSLEIISRRMKSNDNFFK